MKVAVQLGDTSQVISELVVLGVFQGASPLTGAVAAVDEALGGAIGEILAAGDFQGKAEQVLPFYTRGAIPAKRLLLLGLGEQAKFDLDVLRRVSSAAARAVRKLRVGQCHSAIHGLEAGLAPGDAAQAIVEGTILGNYVFTEHKTDLADMLPPLESLTLLGPQGIAISEIERATSIGQSIGEAVCFTRDLVNQPGNYLTPTQLAEVAEAMAQERNLRCEVLEESQMAELGMGALLGVAQGSEEPAKFIILEHNPKRADLDTYVIVGKGITFDSGGISLKPGEGMHEMKYDMSGAAATLGILRAVADLRLPLHVVGLIPATENLPGGRAYKPGDVLKSLSGLTIEVISTDAEGRLILADALAYAKRYRPKGVVDLATLTGACVVALGHVASGLMGNTPDLIQALIRASAKTGEKVWELPLYSEYAEQIKSDVADVKNSGGRPAGAITGGLFLSKFAEGLPWAHLDIAGTAWSDSEKGYLAKGATGFGVRLVLQWLRDRVEA